MRDIELSENEGASPIRHYSVLIAYWVLHVLYVLEVIFRFRHLYRGPEVKTKTSKKRFSAGFRLIGSGPGLGLL